MSKPIAIRLQDDSGTVVRWTIQHVPRTINCTLGQKTRVVTGWQFTDHEGYARFAEGNWRDLVAMFHATAQNYGLQLMSELS